MTKLQMMATDTNLKESAALDKNMEALKQKISKAKKTYD